MTTLDEVIAFIQRGNCMDCFHPECELITVEKDDPVPV